MREHSGLTGVILLGVAALSVGAQAAEEALPKWLPAQLVEDFHGAFGEHKARAVHAKGVILQGTFQPSAAASKLSRAAVFTRAVPVIVRFSDFTGLPDIPRHQRQRQSARLRDQIPDARRFESRHRQSQFQRISVATAAQFSALLQALGQSPPGAPSPTPFDTFLASHPRAKTFFTTQKPPPESFATAEYYGVNAFYFTDAQARSVPVRYRFVPEAGQHYLDPAQLRGKSPAYLMDDIAARVAKAPVRFTWLAQIGAPGDAVDDPSVAWPENRRLVSLGVITIDKVGPNTTTSDRSLAFVPGTLPPGIGIADPMLTIRNAAYPVSFHERQ